MPSRLLVGTDLPDDAFSLAPSSFAQPATSSADASTASRTSVFRIVRVRMARSFPR